MKIISVIASIILIAWLLIAGVVEISHNHSVGVLYLLAMTIPISVLYISLVFIFYERFL